MEEKEIVQSLRICSHRTDVQACTECPLFDSEDCMGDMMAGAADLIERLTAENAKAEAERDAALADLADARSCKTCKYACDTRDCSSCNSTICRCRECHIDKMRGNGAACRKSRRKEKRHESCFNQHPPEVVPEDHKRRENDRGAQDATETQPAV